MHVTEYSLLFKYNQEFKLCPSKYIVRETNYFFGLLLFFTSLTFFFLKNVNMAVGAYFI